MPQIEDKQSILPPLPKRGHHNTRQDPLNTTIRLEQVDGAPSHIPAPAPSHISAHIKIPNMFLQSSSIGLSPVKVSSLNGLGAMVWHYGRTDVRRDGQGYHNIPAFSSKNAGITTNRTTQEKAPQRAVTGPYKEQT